MTEKRISLMPVMARMSVENDGWVRCGECGHKLFKITGRTTRGEIEIKCHSCKQLNIYNLNGINK